MKEMYLKVSVTEQVDGALQIIYPYGEAIVLSKERFGKNLVDADVEKKGAEAFRNILNRLIFILNHGGKETVEKIFGLTNIEYILRTFSPEEIADKFEKVKADAPHIPMQGNVYTSKKNRQ